MAAFSHTLAWLTLLFTLSSAQIRGDYSEHCVPSDGFGTYCPTTCGVQDYLQNYRSGVQRDLNHMDDLLREISNLTRGAQDKVVYLKDSQTQALKSSPDLYIQKSSNMLDDVLRFERTILVQEEQLYDLQATLAANEKRLTDLKQLSQQLDQKCKLPCRDTVTIQTITGKDCQDIANKGAKVSGLYYVQPAKAPASAAAPAPFLVYCEIDSTGRGWTVLQRRRDGSVDFNRNWVPYKEGFGYLSPDDSTEFWLGNQKIHLLTVQPGLPYVLRIEMVDWDGVKRNADYAMFKVGPEVDNYRLTYAYYFGGDAGDAFDGFEFGDDVSDKAHTSHNGQQFSTPDRDNDKYSGNCAKQDGSGWWMNQCHAGHLNGKYHRGGTYSQKDVGEHGFDNGIIWATWHNRWYSLKQTTMKIIPINRIQAGGQLGLDFGKGDIPSR
ncbi:fibrinogen gamma chain [Clarias gariepinus]|uniref:fibrinogen gamma chain n=1 Tax=Clarias gariepinus TaxID=13013 RepID=UPI00234DCE5E|nr:fibrinogen gamma chain [Clarias gariepinus]